MSPKLLVLILLLSSSATGLSRAEAIGNIEGFWTGSIQYRGDELTIGLHFLRRNGELQALLDIPSLVYARQAIPVVSGTSTATTIELPFGIGEFSLTGSGEKELQAKRGDFSLSLQRTPEPTFQTREIEFGSPGRQLSGTLYLPAEDRPVPVTVVIAGSGNANRTNWSYSSWAYFYLSQGMGAFIYDRHPDFKPLPDGSIARIEDHADDVMAAIGQIKTKAGVDPTRIGLVGASRGAWIAMSVAKRLPGLSFLVLSSPAAATPAEQETTSVLTRMRADGLSTEDMDAARAYMRLYFYVAQTGQGWPLLASAIESALQSRWMQYVDQPRTLDDLSWWKQNMNFDAVGHLEVIDIPVLGQWGGSDIITPAAGYREKFEQLLSSGRNAGVTTRVYPGADHRLEVGFGENGDGQWHWFGIADGVLEDIEIFIRDAALR